MLVIFIMLRSNSLVIVMVCGGVLVVRVLM